jgi:outer membrane protein OmpA-like peptidoglycan-associated protein
MHLLRLIATLALFAAAPLAVAGIPEMPKLPGVGSGSLLDTVNRKLAEQQVRDGQFEFKTGKAEFAAGNEKRVAGLLKIITDNSSALKTVFPKLTVTAEGHTDADGSPELNRKLSLARAKTVCDALKARGMQLACNPVGVGSSKPLASPEKTAADKQRNRRVLVQMAK